MNPQQDDDAQLSQLLEQAGSILQADTVILANQKIGASRVDPYLVWRASRQQEHANGHRMSFAQERRLFNHPAPSSDFGEADYDIAIWNAQDGFDGHAIHLRLGVWASRQWLLTLRREGDVPFTRQEVALASKLRGILRHGLDVWRQFQIKSQRLAGVERLLDAQDIGIILLDRHGRSLFANAAANILLDMGDAIARSQDSIIPVHLDDAIRLQTAIKYTLRQCADDSDGVRDATVVAISRPNARPLFAAIICVGTSSRQSAPAVAICLVDPQTDVIGELTPTCTMYGLTATETRLACRLVAGMTVQQAAAAIGIKPQTARAYLKQIFAKIGVRRQAELVRVMVASAVRLRVKLTAIS